MSATETVTAAAQTTIEINECMFCAHLKEVCTECDYDGREENDGYFGVSDVNHPQRSCGSPDLNVVVRHRT